MPGRHRAQGPYPPRCLIIARPGPPYFWRGLSASIARRLSAGAVRRRGYRRGRGARRWHPATLLVVPLLPLVAFAARGDADVGRLRLVRTVPRDVPPGLPSSHLT